MAKLSLRILLNHLNEALFMRADDGRLSYCNNLAAKIVMQSSRHCFDSEKQLYNYCQKLSSMDFIAKSFRSVEQRTVSLGMRKDAVVLSTPILKLHIDASEKGHVINKSNMLLSA